MQPSPRGKTKAFREQAAAAPAGAVEHSALWMGCRGAAGEPPSAAHPTLRHQCIPWHGETRSRRVPILPALRGGTRKGGCAASTLCARCWGSTWAWGGGNPKHRQPLFSMLCMNYSGSVEVRALQWCRAGAVHTEASFAAFPVSQNRSPPCFKTRPKILFFWGQKKRLAASSDPPCH